MKVLQLRQARPSLRLASLAKCGRTVVPWLPLTLTFAQPKGEQLPFSKSATETHEHNIFVMPNINWLLPTLVQRVKQFCQTWQRQSEIIQTAGTSFTAVISKPVEQVITSSHVEYHTSSLVFHNYNQGSLRSFIQNSKLLYSSLVSMLAKTDRYFQNNAFARIQNSSISIMHRNFSSIIYLNKKVPNTIHLSKPYLLHQDSPNYTSTLTLEKYHLNRYWYGENKKKSRSVWSGNQASQVQFYRYNHSHISQWLENLKPRVKPLNETMIRYKPLVSPQVEAQVTPLLKPYLHSRVTYETREYRRKLVNLPDQYSKADNSRTPRVATHNNSPVSVIYRQQDVSVPKAESTAPTLPQQDTMPKIDIARISQDVIREIKKRQRVELERRGLL